ncbi:MAG: hypothetical protein ACRDLS_17505 [Solirubrobacteraceae bacterium]
MTGAPQRLRGAWSGIDPDQRFAGLAAGALLFTMFLPWYEKNAFDTESKRFVTDTVSAFGVISFVEAAIFLVAAGVLVLVLARGEGRAFHLPGGDGTVIFAAGLWAALLIFYRVFDRPEVSGQAGTVGIQWGFFAAFVAAGALAFAGQRIRVASRPEPPLRVDAEPAQADPRAEAAPRADATPPASESRTEVVPASEAVTDVPAKRPRPSSRAVTREDAEQLTFDEPPEAPPLRPGEIPPARDRR